jgi:hypothetical protein
METPPIPTRWTCCPFFRKFSIFLFWIAIYVRTPDKGYFFDTSFVLYNTLKEFTTTKIGKTEVFQSNSPVDAKKNVNCAPPVYNPRRKQKQGGSTPPR